MSAAGPFDPVAGALNLLRNCAGAKAGETLLILAEPAELGMYGRCLLAPLGAAAEAIGLKTGLCEVPFTPDADCVPDALAPELDRADHAVFCARLGDQLRFKGMPGEALPVVSYALDAAMLGSPFGTADHRAFVALKEALDRALRSAREIHVTCPLGTDFRGAIDAARDAGGAQVRVRRFPLSVFTPLDCRDFSGRVALARLVTGTGSRYYEPYGFALDGVLFADIAGGRILDWSGPPDEVQRVREHYERVGDLFGIDPWVAHSWHAGIHPGCRYPVPAEASYERWSGGAFGNPRILHFHTCGNYAPGEISLNILDPTIALDGVALWERGTLHPERIPGVAEALAPWPEVLALFRSPAREVGLRDHP